MLKLSLLLTALTFVSPALATEPGNALSFDFNQDGRRDLLVLDPQKKTIEYFETSEENEPVLIETNTELLKNIPEASLTNIKPWMNGELGVFEIDSGAAHSWQLSFSYFRGSLRLHYAVITERDLSTGAYQHIYLDHKAGTKRIETGIQHGPHLFSKRNLTGATFIERWFWKSLKDFSLP